MILEEIRNIKSDVKELRKFGITVGIVIILIGLLFQYAWDNHSVFVILCSTGSVLFINGIIFPKVLLPIQKAWMTLAVVLGFIMTRIILSILFYLVVTPVGIVAKIFGKDFLDRKIEKSKKSYWNKREKIKYSQELTERQF